MGGLQSIIFKELNLASKHMSGSSLVEPSDETATTADTWIAAYESPETQNPAKSCPCS